MVTVIDKKTALVLIDLQKGITSLPTAHNMKDVVANCAKLVAAFRKAGQPIVIVNVNPMGAKWLTTRKEPAPSFPAPGADWLEIVPEIETQPGDIFITKHTWGAFFETALEAELKKREVTGIVIGGVATSIGVEGTAREASVLGYNLAFATDAMTDMHGEAHDRSLKFIFPRMGETDTTDNIIGKL